MAVPLVCSLPLHAPDAVQLVAPVDDHVSVVDEPTEIEEDASVSVGAGIVVAVRFTELEADSTGLLQPRV